MTLQRFSSRTERLDTEFLANSLQGAVKYFRIAGYFRSSIFELVGEELAQIPEVKIVCNSELDLADFLVAGGRDTALKERWNQVDVAAEALLKQQGDFVKEAGLLLKNHYGTVILDKAHKARIKGGVGQDAMQFNNLLAFMHLMAKRTRHLILGTATPIQTHVRELWDLLGILNSGAEFVLGDTLSPW